MGGSIYVTTNKGQLCSFATSNGTLRWVKKYYNKTGFDTAYVSSHDGVVIIGMNSAQLIMGGSKNVLAVDAADGSLLWDFRPDTPTWNNMGMFTDDDRVVFQDFDARVYCLGLHNGTLLWKAGGRSRKLIDVPPYSETWTDGGTIIGADGVVYAASSDGPPHNHFVGGRVHTYRLSDGQLLWEKNLSKAFLTWPVAAKLEGDSLEKLLWVLLLSCTASLAITGTYKAVVAHRPSEVIAMNAETGEEKWHFRLPDWDRLGARGDEEGLVQRLWDLPWRPVCLPVAFSSPSVDGNGTLFFGTMSGIFYGVKDSDKDGVISPSEVSSFDAGGAFLHSGPAFAPGMLAVTTCDTLHVWRF